MLTATAEVSYDNYRMSKQAISVTLNPDNLVWLKGRSRVEGLGSISECLDRLITRARFGRDSPPPVHTMKGALAALAPAIASGGLGVSEAIWQTWRKRWDSLVDGLDTEPSEGRKPARGPATRLATARADGPREPPAPRVPRG